MPGGLFAACIWYGKMRGRSKERDLDPEKKMQSALMVPDDKGVAV